MYRTALVALLAAPAMTVMAAAQAPRAVGGMRGDFLATFGRVESKFIQLAEAVPVDKFNYTPGAGVRTFCEVLVHVGADNYGVSKLIGGAPEPKPELADPRTSTCYADKATIIADMRASFADAKAAVTKANRMDMDAMITAFGASQSGRAWLLDMAEHAGEHLGQLIAYARVNGVKPPWSK